MARATWIKAGANRTSEPQTSGVTHVTTSGTYRYLVKFPDIIDSQSGQIPMGSVIQEAKLWLKTIQGRSSSQVQAYQVLRPWVEGNQDSTPVNVPGRYGVTWDRAVKNYEGEGTTESSGAPDADAAGNNHGSTATSAAVSFSSN